MLNNPLDQRTVQHDVSRAKTLLSENRANSGYSNMNVESGPWSDAAQMIARGYLLDPPARGFRRCCHRRRKEGRGSRGGVICPAHAGWMEMDTFADNGGGDGKMPATTSGYNFEAK